MRKGDFVILRHKDFQLGKVEKFNDSNVEVLLPNKEFWVTPIEEVTLIPEERLFKSAEGAWEGHSMPNIKWLFNNYMEVGGLCTAHCQKMEIDFTSVVDIQVTAALMFWYLNNPYRGKALFKECALSMEVPKLEYHTSDLGYAFTTRGDKHFLIGCLSLREAKEYKDTKGWSLKELALREKTEYEAMYPDGKEIHESPQREYAHSYIVNMSHSSMSENLVAYLQGFPGKYRVYFEVTKGDTKRYFFFGFIQNELCTFRLLDELSEKVWKHVKDNG